MLPKEQMERTIQATEEKSSEIEFKLKKQKIITLIFLSPVELPVFKFCITTNVEVNTIMVQKFHLPYHKIAWKGC